MSCKVRLDRDYQYYWMSVSWKESDRLPLSNGRSGLMLTSGITWAIARRLYMNHLEINPLTGSGSPSVTCLSVPSDAGTLRAVAQALLATIDLLKGQEIPAAVRLALALEGDGVMEVQKCDKCRDRIEELGGLAPVGWRPFAWGPEDGEQHFYVFPESTPKCPQGAAQELDVRPLCQLADARRRKDAVERGTGGAR